MEAHPETKNERRRPYFTKALIGRFFFDYFDNYFVNIDWISVTGTDKETLIEKFLEVSLHICWLLSCFSCLIGYLNPLFLLVMDRLVLRGVLIFQSECIQYLETLKICTSRKLLTIFIFYARGSKYSIFFPFTKKFRKKVRYYRPLRVMGLGPPPHFQARLGCNLGTQCLMMSILIKLD